MPEPYWSTSDLNPPLLVVIGGKQVGDTFVFSRMMAVTALWLFLAEVRRQVVSGRTNGVLARATCYAQTGLQEHEGDQKSQ